MSVRIRSRSSLRVAVAAGIAVVLSLSLVSSIKLARPDPGPAAPAPLKIGELPERRMATSTTRRNENGSFTTTVYNGPVNYRTGDGSWQPIDATLHKINEGGYAWRSGANAFQARFKSTVGAGFSELRVGGRLFRITAEGAAPSVARVDGSKISYPGAFPGADLTYTVGTTGVKEVIDLAGPDSPTSYTFRLSPADQGSAPSVQRRTDGSYWVMTPPLRGPAFVLSAPLCGRGPGRGRWRCRRRRPSRRCRWTRSDATW